jgi:transcriptional regulator with XRE-family HTH domain
MNDSARLGDVLRRTYREAALTQGELAQAVGVSQSTVSDWVNGRSAPSVLQVVQLDRACKRPAGYIMRRSGLIDDPDADLIDDLRVLLGESAAGMANVEFADVRRLYESIIERLGEWGPDGEHAHSYALRAAWCAVAAATTMGRTVDDRFIHSVTDWAEYQTNERERTA